MFKKKWFRVAVTLLFVLGFLVLKTYRDAGEFKAIQSIGGEDCRLITGVLSSEDITIHPQTGMAFISSDDRRAFVQGKSPKNGAILGFDLSQSAPELMNLTPELPFVFRPHGIGLIVISDTTFLFVVNHRPDASYVEIFAFDGERLHHLESIHGEPMHSPNDVLPVGRRRFYVTNDHGSSSGWGKTLEDYLQLERSYLLYYDGQSFRKVAGGMGYANGVNMSPDGKQVYVAATTSKAVFVFDRDPESGDLTPRQKIDLGTGVDNIEVDANGDLWIGAHPKLLTFVAYSENAEKRSPSQVVRIQWRSRGNYDIHYVYASDGRPLSGSSVAAVWGEHLLIGSVFDPAFLWCKR